MMYHLLNFSIRLLSLLPFPVLYILSDGLGFLLYHIVRYRRRVVRSNLTESFPEKSIEEIQCIEKRFYRFFTDNILETCKIISLSPSEMSRRMNFTNISEVNNVLRQGKSIGIYLGHFGNWEWISSMPIGLYQGAIAAQIYHRLRNKDFDRLMLRLRSHFGAVNVEMYQTARYINSLNNDGKECIIGFIADQSPKKKEVRDYLPFLNHQTPVLTGTEKIIKHFGFESWFLRVTRVRRGHYDAEFVKMCPDPRTLPDYELTDIYYRMLESEIRRQPELYLWSHKRFKHASVIESDTKDVS
ncbi:MAG: lysophospholipid acyltransferase family protein [Muribaculaceae bacterium]|nr:lysophospholipid acyltransferase family protein [Muribaculaceae bacterium]